MRIDRRLSLGGLFIALQVLAFQGAIAATAPPPKTPAPAPLPVAIPAIVTVGLLSSPIANDGTTAVITTLKNADGSLFTGAATVQLSSPCAATGTALLEAQVSARDGIAAASYIATGCSGADTITAKVTIGGRTVTGVVNLMINATASLSAKAGLGRTLFFDRGLSAGGNVACASCHSPAGNWAPVDDRGLPLGGISGAVAGFRTAPTAAYASVTPAFSFLAATNRAGTVNNGASGKLGTPRRGLMWDGRASTVFDQAKGPFVSSHEMANANSAAVLAKLLTRPYLTAFRTVYGPVTSQSNPDTVLTLIADALARYESEERSFVLFNSKFDAVSKNLASFTPQEARGQQWFNDANKGACAGCHNSNGAAQATPGPQMFTDLSYRTLAVPRNWRIPYNVDATAPTALAAIGQTGLLNGTALGAPGHKYYDLGFCGPFRTDSVGDAALCGAFRVPGLRNVALKSSYEHNGVFSSLAQVIDFYVNRDITPQKFYLKADGTPDIAYNDLPVIYQNNREIRPPFTPPRAGVRLNAADVQDLIAFMCTLTDGFDPQQPQAYRLPQQCRQAIRP